MVSAVIAEYNPFHKGHRYHIEETKKITNNDIIAIISGNFVQRGEPAIIDKHTRAKMALLNGVSVVLELPIEYATGSADVFAFGAINILNNCGIVDRLSFGSEEGSTKIFENIADILNNEPYEFKSFLKTELNKGISFPLARIKALENYMNKDLSFLNKPNNILGLEYIKELKKTNSSILPVTIERIVSEYNSKALSGEISSASAIRTALINRNYSALDSVPENCIPLIKNKNMPCLDDFSSILSYILRTKTAYKISQYADVTEGLENRIINTDFKNITELIEKLKTKRYTYSKLQKALLHIILGITKEAQKKSPEYIRVLGFRKDKKHIISELNKKAKLPVITSVKDNEDILKKEIMATDIYNIAVGNKKGTEYSTPIVLV